MRADDLFPDDPPLEAYSRVTEPERFQPLHTFALHLLEKLGAEYEVDQSASFNLLPWMSSFEFARAPVALTPALSAAAPVAVAFTTFPSLLLRFGRWQEDRFPSCGCDACHETADGEGERFERVIRAVVAGQFREELKIPWLREARLRWWFGERPPAPHYQGGGSRMVSRQHLGAIRHAGHGTVEWQPWPRRHLSGAA